MRIILFQQLGGSDCELIGGGMLAQPVNALTSLAFWAVGLLIIRWAFAVKGRERAVRGVFGLLLILTGLGSFLFHGTQGQGSQFVHDASFLVAIWFVASTNIARACRSDSVLGWVVFAIGSIVFTAAVAGSAAVTNTLMVLAVVALVASDVALRSRFSVRRWWYGASLVASIAGLAMFVIGRTGSPACNPESLWQGHGAWHVLGAVALGAYFVATSEAIAHRRQEEV